MKQTFKHYKNKRNFFEGYFIKCCNKDEQIAIIPAFTADSCGEVTANIQILTKGKSYYKVFTTKDFDVEPNCFSVQIDKNTFNKNGVVLDFETNGNIVKGQLSFGTFNPIKQTLYAPSIMGPFSYLKFLECYHFVLSTSHLVSGEITINDKVYKFDNDRCYIEGDYGRSFPTEWFYAQGNCFNSSASFMISIAKLKNPKMVGNLGFIRDKKSGLDLVLGSYYLTKIHDFSKTPTGHKVTIHHKDYTIYLETDVQSKEKLLAPQQGKLNTVINEATEGTATLKVYKRDKLIFSDTTNNISSECTINDSALYCL